MTALANQRVTPEVLALAQALAPVVHQSRLFGVTSEQQALTIMLVGYELGFNLTGSFSYVHVIKGKPSVSPEGVLARVLASGQLAEWKHETDRATFYRVWMKRKNGLEHSEMFTLQDAIKADLVKPESGWVHWTANMLKWRTIGFCLDILFPDIVTGLLRWDELDVAVTDAGALVPTEGDV